jgi:hypothetical protein
MIPTGGPPASELTPRPMPIPSDRSDAPPRPGVPVVRAGARAVERAAAGGDPVPRPRRALELLADALCAARPSMGAVRDAAVRYGGAAREVALAPDEMTVALGALLRRCAARHAPAMRAELEASVPWWAAHGYHRAD